MVTHVCNPVYSGDVDWEDRGLGPVPAKERETLSEITKAKRGWGWLEW
jgi:hypothetical protein